MNVLILSQHFWPETFRINEIAHSLRAAGCRVSVLTGQPNYPDGDVFPGYRAWRAGVEDYDGVPVYRVPLAPRGRSGALRLAGNYLSFLLSASVAGPWLLRGRRFDVVFVYGTSPILQVLPALVLRAFKGCAVVTWVQDLWPQSLQVTGYVRHPRVLAMVAGVVRWLYRRSDLLLVQSRGFLSSVQPMAGGTPVEVHPNPGEVAFERAPDGAPALALEPGFNVVFAGNLGTVQALDTVVAAAALLRDEPHVRFVLVGSGSRGEALAAQAQRLGLANVAFPGRFPVDAMPGILAQASALLVSLKRDDILAQTVPSKVQAYLAAGRPVIASLDGEGARVVEEAGAGIACPAEDAQALADAVRRLAGAPPAELAAMGGRARAYYQTHFEPAMLAERLARRFAQLAGVPPSAAPLPERIGSDHG
ncbi:MAG TPA: glycosyltransferase family 4 protein [Burkholderiales bacterium]|nr:glycosyltransferase family 4 protein [Burkholderiales bacterium]